MNNNLVNEELIARYLTGNVNDEERQMILSWLNESRENERQLFLMKDMYDAGAMVQLHKEAQTNEGWKKLQETITQKKQPKTASTQYKKTQVRLGGHFGKYAAIFVLGILAGALSIYFYSKQGKVQIAVSIKQCEITTGRGERVSVTLPDGSTVKLNACSYLAYPSDFGNRMRELHLIGEGYFDVQTNAEIPFVVKTSGLNIKALGTTFNIKAYADEDIVETTLVKGIVTIENEYNHNIVTLKPKQVVTIPKKLIATNSDQGQVITKHKEPVQKEPAPDIAEPQTVLIDKIEPALYTSWKDERWIIESESLESLAKKMERKYDVSFFFEDEASKEYTFTGTLKNYPLEQILEGIRLNAPVQYIVKEKNVIIREDKQLKNKYQHLIQSPIKPE